MIEMRAGLGYDVHRFAELRKLYLGGVEIPHERGLLGHSDADALLHAIMDAILGAAALGDIGVHFPPSDSAYKDISSLELCRRVLGLISAAGWNIVNIDATMALERPKIAPYSAQMRKRIAEAFSIEESRVSIKATTNEQMGFVGREEGIAAWAIAMLAKKED